MSTEPIYNYFSTDLVPDISNDDVTTQNNSSNEQNQERETAFESKLKRLSDKSLHHRLISGKNMSKLRESLSVSGIFNSENGQNITVRELPKISQEDFDKFKNSITDNETINKLYSDLNTINCNYKSVESNNSIGGLSPLTFLVENSYSMSVHKAKEINDKYNLLKKYIFNYRTVNGDGNCFYRAVMFRYLEILVLNKQIEYLQDVTYDVYNSFNSEELKSRLVIGNINLKPALALKLLILIIELLKKGNVLLAHNILVKSFSCCRKFDYAIIFYFRYILYDFIKKSEEKTYIKSFPIKLGNLLPSQYETEEGKFLYESFYQNYLLKFYTDAEKIVIYLTPFVLGVALNVLIYDANDEEILQNFKWEEGHGLNLSDEINLLNRKNHYEIVYMNKEYEKYKNIYEFYENHKKSVILSDIEKHLKAIDNDKNFDMLKGSFDVVNPLINNPKTMIIKNNNLSKNFADNNKTGNNKINNKQININKVEYPNNNMNKNNTKVENKNNNNNNNTDDLNPKVKVVKRVNNNNTSNSQNGNINNINNTNNNNISKSEYINNIKNNINNYKEKKANMNSNILDNGINNNNQKYYSTQIKSGNGIQANLNGNNQFAPQIENIKKNYQQNINVDNKVNQSCIPTFNNLQKGQNLSIYSKQIMNQKINGKQNEIYKNISITESKQSNINNNIIYSKNNNANNNSYTNINKPYQNNTTNNIPKNNIKEIGLKTPGNGPMKSENNSNNKSNFTCISCKKPTNNGYILFCKNCFKNEIINVCYLSYLSVLNQEKPPEQIIYGNISITNIKNEKITYNLDKALFEYNKIFPGENLDRKNIILELKKRICIACTNDIKDNKYIELPCKCRVCCINHLNNYLFYYFKDYHFEFTCKCKKNYTPRMMLQLGIQEQLNENVFIKIRSYFQKRLDSCCCICSKPENLTGRSNSIFCLDNPENNRFLSQIYHLFCLECCRKYQNSEFYCQACQIKHYWNSN